MPTFSTIAALGTEKLFGWALCQALRKTHILVPPAIAGGSLLHWSKVKVCEQKQMMDADTQKGGEREAGKRTGSWSEILLPSVDQSSNWAQGRETNGEKEWMKLVKTNRDALPMRKLKLQIRKRFLRKVKLGNRLYKEEQGQHLLQWGWDLLLSAVFIVVASSHSRQFRYLCTRSFTNPCVVTKQMNPLAWVQPKGYKWTKQKLSSKTRC